MILRKQTAVKQTFCATLEFSPSKMGYEAGIVVWWSMYSYLSIGITNKDTVGKNIMIRCPGSISRLGVEKVRDISKIVLRLVTKQMI